MTLKDMLFCNLEDLCFTQNSKTFRNIKRFCSDCVPCSPMDQCHLNPGSGSRHGPWVGLQARLSEAWSGVCLLHPDQQKQRVFKLVLIWRGGSVPSEPQGQTFKCVTDCFFPNKREDRTAQSPIKLCCGTQFCMTMDKDERRGG